LRLTLQYCLSEAESGSKPDRSAVNILLRIPAALFGDGESTFGHRARVRRYDLADDSLSSRFFHSAQNDRRLIQVDCSKTRAPTQVPRNNRKATVQRNDEAGLRPLFFFSREAVKMTTDV